MSFISDNSVMFANARDSVIFRLRVFLEEKMKSTKEPPPELDMNGIDDAVLALLYLNLHHCGVAWKGFDWGAMNRLFEKELISDPVRKAKSVGFSEDGERRAKELFEQMFVVKEP